MEKIMEIMQKLKDIAADPLAYARNWKKETGRKVIGSLCSYAPEELILAGGALAFRMVGGSGSITRADAHLQAYSCSLVRGALEDFLHGRGAHHDGPLDLGPIRPGSSMNHRGQRTLKLTDGGPDGPADDHFVTHDCTSLNVECLYSTDPDQKKVRHGVGASAGPVKEYLHSLETALSRVQVRL